MGRLSFVAQSISIFGSKGGRWLRRRGSAIGNFFWPACAALTLILVVGVQAPAAETQDLIFQIPPVKIPLTVKDQAVSITASAVISMVTKDQGQTILKLELVADLAELQQNMTALLSSQLDKEDHCGDRITIEKATLTPADPASLAAVYLHYERWACVKAFGKKEAKRLVGGNAMIPLKLTPAVEADNTELRLVPEVGTIQADGSLGDLLRSGPVGEMIRDKIRAGILSAMQKGTNLSATLPPAAQEHAAIKNVEFKDAGAGRLKIVLYGEVRLTQEELQMLSTQVKERLATAKSQLSRSQ